LPTRYDLQVRPPVEFFDHTPIALSHRCSAGLSDFLISANVLCGLQKPIGLPADWASAERFK